MSTLQRKNIMQKPIYSFLSYVFVSSLIFSLPAFSVIIDIEEVARTFGNQVAARYSTQFTSFQLINDNPEYPYGMIFTYGPVEYGQPANIRKIDSYTEIVKKIYNKGNNELVSSVKQTTTIQDIYKVSVTQGIKNGLNNSLTFELPLTYKGSLGFSHEVSLSNLAEQTIWNTKAIEICDTFKVSPKHSMQISVKIGRSECDTPFAIPVSISGKGLFCFKDKIAYNEEPMPVVGRKIWSLIDKLAIIDPAAYGKAWYIPASVIFKDMPDFRIDESQQAAHFNIRGIIKSEQQDGQTIVDEYPIEFF